MHIQIFCCIFARKIHKRGQMTNKEIYLAGGCFWGTEHFFKQIAGVEETEVGFANGHTDAPTYEQVYTDTTGYVETVRVEYDPQQVSLEFLLEMFFVAIDPTSLNKQGHDEGTRYRTGIYYTDETDRAVIDRVYAEEQTKCAMPIVVERGPLKNFYPADEYHQDYLDKHPDGYCHLPKALFDFARQAKKRIEVVAAVIFDEQGRIFATQRGYGDWKDWWEFPGGKIEAGETPREALKREIREELEAEIEIGELMKTIDYDYPKFHLTMHCFKCRLMGGVTLKEHEAAKWLAPNDLQTVQWLPADEDFIKELRK